MKPIGIEHFFDAFSLEKKRPLKSDAASALNIQVKDVSDSLVVNQDKAKRFELTPVWAPAEPPAKRAKTAEVRLSSAFFFALCCLGKIPGGAPFSQLHKSGNGSRVDRP